ncbi:MAG: tetratricopeptide repeat protein [Acidobacteria bacterium]|nr:tetratricopeptide repeat protein [Acidobacteriota bacterium]
MMTKKIVLGFALSAAVFAGAAYSQTKARALSVETEPGAAVWVNDVKRGVTDSAGKIEIRPVSPGILSLRVRAKGFKETALRITAAQKTVKVALVKTSDPAEIAFQEGEAALGDDTEKAIELYQRSIKLDPKYLNAYIALARALTGNDNEAAHEAVAKARKLRPNYAEASAVEARIFRSDTETEKAIDSFERAIREGKGFQPEAYTGLGLIYQDKAESAAASGEFDDEKFYYEEAANAFEKAIDQLSATEPVVYILLGAVYEKAHEKEKAIRVYERFLRDFPVNSERTAVASFIVQLKKEMSEEEQNR